MIVDRATGPVYPHKELISRLRGDQCELCQTHGEVEVHHIRSMASLARSTATQPQWAQVMIRRRRKTLVVCAACHASIHDGPKPLSTP